MSAIAAHQRRLAREEAEEQRAARRLTWSRRLLWASLLSAFVYSPPREAFQIADAGGALWDIVRGGGASLLLVGGHLAHQQVRAPRGFYGWVEVFWLLFGVTAVGSAGWADDPMPTLFKAGAWGLSLLAAIALARRYESRNQLIRALAGLTHGLLVLALVEFALFRDLTYAPLGAFDAEPRLRLIAPQIGSNSLAFLAALGTFALLLGIGPRWAKRPSVRLGLFAWYVSALWLTGTRVGVVMLLVLGVGLMVLSFRRRPFEVTYIVGWTGLAGWLLWDYYREPLIEFSRRGQSDQQLSSLTGRTDYWQIGIDAWLAGDRLLGLGYYTGHRTLPGLSTTQANLDNTWVETLVDVGVVGLVCLVVGTVAGLVRLARWRTDDSATKWLTWAIVLYGLVASLLSPTVQSPGIGMIYLAIPLLTRGDQEDGAATTQAPQTRSVRQACGRSTSSQSSAPGYGRPSPRLRLSRAGSDGGSHSTEG